MIEINEYILLSKEDRQKHLRLEDPCIERGGPIGRVSTYCKGLLAHVLDTSIPSGLSVYVCHACNNDKCSNPKHLYWGTPRENCLDRIEYRKMTGWDYTIAKLGTEESKNLMKKKGVSGGKGNKGIPKSEEHKRKISEAIKKKAEDKKKQTP